MKEYINHKRKIFISIFATLILLLFIYFIYSFIVDRTTLANEDKWDGVSIATSFSSGNGTIDNPYLISNGSEFIYFKNLIEGNDANLYKDKYYKLSNDIDFDNHSFTSIGNILSDNENIFMGNFDGNGYSLNNILIDNPNTYDSIDYYGIFSTTKNATISNLNISNINIKVKDSSNNMRIGTISGVSLVDDSSDNTSDILSTFKNISINNSVIDISDTLYDKNTYIGGFSGYLDKKINAYNIYLNNNFNTKYKDNIASFSYSLNSEISNIILNINSNNYEASDFLFNINGEGSVKNNYYFNNNKYYLEDKEVSTDDILSELNSFNDSDYYFEFIDNTFKCLAYEKKAVNNSNNNSVAPIMKTFSMTSRVNGDIPIHASGISNGVVYVNDLESSWNYYMGLNYSEVTSGALPTYSEKYSSSNLVPIAISYSGEDYNDSSLVGHVSPTESETKYIYYKYYPIVDGKVKIELIDNPFSARPKKMGFYGWNTSYNGGVLSFDNDTYTRYLTIPVSGTDKISIEMYAIWDSANISSSSSDLYSAGMRKVPLYEDVCETKYYDDDLYEFQSGVEYYEKRVASRGSRYTGYIIETTTSTGWFGSTTTTQSLKYMNNTTCSNNEGCTYYVKVDYDTPDMSLTYVTLTKRNSGGWWDDSTYIDEKQAPINTVHKKGDSYEICHKELREAFNTTGYFYKFDMMSFDDKSLFYNGRGQNCSVASCSYGDTYKLIQNSDSYSSNYDNLDKERLYYLVTRDTNILLLSNSGNLSNYLSTSKPMTITASYDGSSISSSRYLAVSSDSMNLRADMTIENVYINGQNSNSVSETINTKYALNASSYNLKVGRNILHTNPRNYYKNLNTIIGTSNRGSSTNYETYKVIVESGVYNALLTAYGIGSSNSYYVHAQMVYGSDYDRVNNDNTKLSVYFNALASIAGNYNSDDKVTPSSDMVIKSGRYGVYKSGNNLVLNSNEAAYGIYVGGRSGTHYSNSLRRLTMLGGEVNSLNGGPCVETNLSTNSTAFYMLGGYVNSVYGGAATTTSYGNRIVSITGGTVGYNVFGGSNAYNGYSEDGQLSGSTLLYIGGNSVIGSSDTSGNHFNAEHGSVFGAGNGKTGVSDAGKVYSSHVIINDNTVINGNVYGGGNYGFVGFDTNRSKDSTVEILGGTIKNNVYGSGNNIGNGKTSASTTGTQSDAYIIQKAGVVNGSIYGGSRTNGTVKGSATVTINGGEVGTDVYGGGEGSSTVVGQNTTVIIGNNESTNSPTIKGNVYGGSAYGSVNRDGSTSVTVNKGTIANSVFGGGKGTATQVPYTYGDITVTINNGNIGRVFGGFDNAGTPSKTDTIYVNNGVIGDLFGGGNKTGQTTTNIYVKGGEISNLYGGSNEKGGVTTSNIEATAGTLGYVYGGNNIAGTTNTTNVNLTDVKVTGDIYGGGNKASSKTSNVVISNISANDVYGGGREAGLTDSKVLIDTSTMNKVFGGSNISGDVSTTNVSVSNSKLTSLYGGNNQGGSVGTTTLKSKDTDIGDVFGGGDNAEATTSNLDIDGGIIGNVFGGGNQAGVVTTNTNISRGFISGLYGGSNETGTITSATINTPSEQSATTTTINRYTLNINKSVSASDWRENSYPGYITYANLTITLTNNTSKDINEWDASLYIPNSILYSNYSSTEIKKDGDIYSFNHINRNYGTNPLKANGGSYTFNFEILTKNTQDKFNIISYDPAGLFIGNLYGGNNLGGELGSSDIDLNYGSYGTIYGGGNEAVVNSTKLNISNSTATNIYGGGNAAKVTGSTYLRLTSTDVSNNVYGGGNQGEVNGNTEVFVSSGSVSGNLFAGGNGASAIVSSNTSVTIDDGTVIGTETSVAPNAGCVFGGGNAADSGSSSNTSKAVVNIVGAIIHGNVYGGAKMAKVTGTTDTNIGTDAVSEKKLKETDIIISGTVFGGGESNANASETYDWSFISVTDGITVDINGNNYIKNNHEFIINGSIFGSGNASSSSGTSIINVTDLGSKQKPNKSISIQRADELTIKSSFIELVGTTDRTNEYSDILYSFNMIDKLNVLNNSTLLLQHNANMLKELYSGIEENNKISPATVTIDDDTKKVTKNVDNRIYMSPNQNLNISINQAATAYGKVTGMSFLGMYTSSNGAYRFGVYDEKISYGDTGNAGLAIIGGSYVLGLHSVNHDITKDGFYSNTLSDDYSVVNTAYIDPTPVGDTGYRWVIGLSAINYNITLNASKYSTLGTYELQMLDFADGDTSFNILGFNSEELVKDVSLVDSAEVPRIGKTEEDANNILGLSIKSETQEWTSYGTTKFISEGTGKYTGTSEYLTDSRKIAPSLMFYLYHAKNISRNGPMGKVVIMLQAATPINEIDYKIQLITISVDIMSKKYNDADSYDASITYDKRYEMPSTTLVNITNKSQFTAYYSLIANASKFENAYGINNDYYHVLTTNNPLPVGTMITMLDFGQNSSRPEYYLYEITQDIYDNSLRQLESDGEISYSLSDFIKMGSVNKNNRYNDAVANKKYYSDGLVDEEFIFIFDLKNSNQTGTHLDNSMLFELRNSEGRSVYSVLGIRQGIMNYNTYDQSNAILEQNILNNEEYLYYNITDEVNYSTHINYDQTENRQSIIDTNYESNNMGLNVSFYSNDGEIVSSSLLSSSSIRIDGVDYFADSDGVFRIRLAGKVSNLNKKLNISVGKDLPSGVYTMRYTLFASEDGLHNSDIKNSVSKDFIVHVVSSNDTIIVNTDDKYKVIDGDTHLNLAGINRNIYDVKYTSSLNNPNIRLEILKRDISSSDSSKFESIPFNNLFKNNMTVYSGNEVLLNMGLSNSYKFYFDLNDEFTSGTYKLVFKLYDNNQLIDSDVQYVIVKKKT